MPKILPAREDVMQYYSEMLPDYLPNSLEDSTSPTREYEESKLDSPLQASGSATAASTNNSSAAAMITGSSKMAGLLGPSLEAASQSAPPKKTKEEIESQLQDSSSIHRQKFLDSLNALQSAANVGTKTTTSVSAGSPTI